jgi:hypothetical protein
MKHFMLRLSLKIDAIIASNTAQVNTKEDLQVEEITFYPFTYIGVWGKITETEKASDRVRYI